MKFETCQKQKSLQMKYLSPDAGISLVSAKDKIYYKENCSSREEVDERVKNQNTVKNLV